MSSKDEKNFELRAVDDIAIDFLPIWMNDINIYEQVVETTERASDVADPEPAETAQAHNVSGKLNDTKQDDNEVSDEEPPLKKLKVAAMPVGVCNYEYCNLVFNQYCITCQGFYCEVHAPIDIHECIPEYSPPSSLSSFEEDDGKFNV